MRPLKFEEEVYFDVGRYESKRTGCTLSYYALYLAAE